MSNNLLDENRMQRAAPRENFAGPRAQRSLETMPRAIWGSSARIPYIDHLLIIAAPSGAGKSTFIDGLKAGSHDDTIKQLIPAGTDKWGWIETFGAIDWAHQHLDDIVDGKKNIPGLILHFAMLQPLRRARMTFRDPRIMGLIALSRQITVINLKSKPEIVIKQLHKRWFGDAPGSIFSRAFLRRVKAHVLGMMWWCLNAMQSLLHAIPNRIMSRVPLVRSLEIAVEKELAKGGLWNAYALLHFCSIPHALDDWWDRWDEFLCKCAHARLPIRVIDLTPDRAGPNATYRWALVSTWKTGERPPRRREPEEIQMLRRRRRAWPVLGHRRRPALD